MPPIISAMLPAMKSIEKDNGGPVIPRSKSRATVRSLVSPGSSRCPMPGGRTQASVSRSYNHAAVRSPRLKLSAVWIGVNICSRMNTTPTSSRAWKAAAVYAAGVLHGGDDHAGGNREDRGQHTAQDEHDPPSDGQQGIGLRQDAEELPLLTPGQPAHRGQIWI